MPDPKCRPLPIPMTEKELIAGRVIHRSDCKVAWLLLTDVEDGHAAYIFFGHTGGYDSAPRYYRIWPANHGEDFSIPGMDRNEHFAASVEVGVE